LFCKLVNLEANKIAFCNVPSNRQFEACFQYGCWKLLSKVAEMP